MLKRWVKRWPWPLSQVSVTGLPGASGPRELVDRAGDFGRVDADAVAGGERGLEIARFLGLVERIGQPAFARVLHRGALSRRVCALGRGLLARRSLGIEAAHHQVEAEQQRQTQHDGEDEVALVVQIAILSEIGACQVQGTGSNPWPPHGWQRISRLAAIHPPLIAPCFSSA